METVRLPALARPARRMFVRDLILAASIGVHAHEHAARQRVRINLDLEIDEEAAPNPAGDLAARPFSRPAVGADELTRVVDYEKLVIAARALVAEGHVQLVETLAERLAEICLTDARVRGARVTVEKLDVFADAASAGVTIERHRR